MGPLRLQVSFYHVSRGAQLQLQLRSPLRLETIPPSMLPHDCDQRLHAMRMQRRDWVRVRLVRLAMDPLIPHHVEVPLNRFGEAPDGVQTGGYPLAADRFVQVSRAGGEGPMGDVRD